MSRKLNCIAATLISSGMAMSLPLCSYAESAQNAMVQFGEVVIPTAFSSALRNGMSIPFFIRINGTDASESDPRIGSAFIWLDGDKLKIKSLQLDADEGDSILSKASQDNLNSLNDKAFNNELIIALSDNESLKFNLKQLNLQLIVEKSALGTILQKRSKDIGASSVSHLSTAVNYNLGIYNNHARSGDNNTSSFLSLNSVTSILEHHLILNGAFYGIGTSQRSSTLYKALYERDFNGYRFAFGQLDSWSLQSLGPVTAIPSGKILGVSWGNQANSTIFDNSQSITPIIAFLPAPGEVYIYREGRLLSIQNFEMGNHEIDTRSLPYGTYDVTVEVLVNNTIVDKRTQRINKLFTNNGAGAPFSWQVWGGSLKMDKWQTREDNQTETARNAGLVGVSASGSLGVFSWTATAYGYDKNAITEAQVSLPITENISINTQSLLASDSSWSSIANIVTTLPGGFSTLWATHEKTQVGDRLRKNDANNISVGGTLNLGAAWEPLGSLTVSYNNDKQAKNHYYTADYTQNLYTGNWGNLNMRAGVQRYGNNDNINTGKYVSFDFSLPLGNWFSAGVSSQRGYTLANVAARKYYDEGPIRTVGVNASRAISGDTNNDKTLSGGGYALFDTRYSQGSLNINSGADGYINTNLTANGSVGWAGGNIAASGNSDGDSGVIFNTNIDNDGSLSADVNGRKVELKNGANYLPLASYGQYNIEIMNSKKSASSYNIAKNRKTQLTLYPGNVAVVTPEIKQMVTVFGRIRAEDGTFIANAHINNHIGRTKTNDNGEFVMDIDKKFPTIDFRYGKNEQCEIELNLDVKQGAIWVGDVTCTGLKTYASTALTGVPDEG